MAKIEKKIILTHFKLFKQLPVYDSKEKALMSVLSHLTIKPNLYIYFFSSMIPLPLALKKWAFWEFLAGEDEKHALNVAQNRLICFPLR
jgi:hypothetical protein